MKNDKLIKTLRRKNCTIRVFECPTLERGFYGLVTDNHKGYDLSTKKSGKWLYMTDYQYTADEALVLAQEHAI